MRALVIGIDKYPNLDDTLQLRGAVADALDISQALAAAGAKVQTLTDGDAARSRVVAEMNRLVDESRSGDLVIIAYSGHGMRVRAYRQWDGLDASRVHSQIVMSRFSPSSADTGHDVIVDREMRAWYARFDKKDVDVLVVMDTCYGGHMRQVAQFAAGMTVRSIPGDVTDAIHDSFEGIPMSQLEARADIKKLSHVTFFAGASETSTVPEMSGIDPANRTAWRGALSYFVARSIEGAASRDGKVTREQLFKYLSPHVRQATEGRQFIDFEPRVDGAEAMQKVIFRTANGFANNETAGAPKPGADMAPQTPPAPQILSAQNPAGKVEPMRIAIANGPQESFSTIENARAPFVASGRPEADLVWDVGHSEALSRGDLIMRKVDGSVLGAVIDRTWAIREIQKLATPQIIDVRMGEDGKSYTLGDRPELVADGVRDSYLTAVNIAADGTIQMLFPFYASHNPHILNDRWTYSPEVQPPFGTDYTVVIATSGPATDLIAWLRAHNLKPDAFELPAVIARAIKTDPKTRLGTAGLYTH